MNKIFKTKKRIAAAAAAVIVLLALISFFMVRRMSSVDLNLKENITITSNAFTNGGTIPVRYTGKGEDVSPDLELSSISPEAKSIAIIMNDLDFPTGVFNHWVIWNLPPMLQIPEAIPQGAQVGSLGGAIQGKGYGVNRYKGPNPPFGTHRYKFNVYVLDTMINLSSNAGKKDLLKQMDGHVLQYGSITGKFR